METARHPARAHHDAIARTVLVIDPDADIRALIAFKIRRLHLDVATAGDGEAGLATARADQPDLIILDWDLPRLSGLDVVAAIRADESLRDVRIIMLTARARDDDMSRAFGAGVDDYLIKPFSPTELTCRITALLRRVAA